MTTQRLLDTILETAGAIAGELPTAIALARKVEAMLVSAKTMFADDPAAVTALNHSLADLQAAVNAHADRTIRTLDPG